MAKGDAGKRTIHIPEIGELTVEELEEVAGGSAELNGYCPTTNKSGCNTNCGAAVADAS